MRECIKGRKRVLVVGTTGDYIELISRRHPGRALFVTAADERMKQGFQAPDEISEIVADLEQPDEVIGAIERHLAKHGIKPAGIACFDCESMNLASLVAGRLAIAYPSPESISACRNKFVSKELWRRAGLDCPRAAVVSNASEAESFFGDCPGRKAMLKPLTGAGSEHILVCRSLSDCDSAVGELRRRLAEQGDARMYAINEYGGHRMDPRRLLLMEEVVGGIEYSCDFFIDGDSATIIRIARKWMLPGAEPGIALAYGLPEEVPPPMTPGEFKGKLVAAARALGIDRRICMLDFFMDGDRMMLIELAPRPGGDCLPHLIDQSGGVDVIGLELDVAEGRLPEQPDHGGWRYLVGMRLFAEKAGTIAALDAGRIQTDPRTREVVLKRLIGDTVNLPPMDYQSRVLGHAIFEPYSRDAIPEECHDLRKRLMMEIRSEDAV